MEHGYERREEPFRLSSGKPSRDYIDAKFAMSQGERLRTVCDALLDLAEERGVTFTAVGGLTMGADAVAHAVAVLKGCDWFSVRKEAKGHGKQSLVEGARLNQESTVLLVDDVVTTGGSILQALDAIEDTGARVVLAVSLCDRGTEARGRLAARKVPYDAVVTFEDLGIEPVSG